MKKTTQRPPASKSSKTKPVKRAKPVRPCYYPFSAIVGQDEMKLALMLNAVDPTIGGVLIMGHRGTGKSTAVRGLADLLPEIKLVPRCLYRCDPSGINLCTECEQILERGERLAKELGPVAVVDLPLGATEDRVCGSIDIERALQQGTKAFEPGLLARANRGVLYIDEVNLLDDHLVDILLDVAVTGVNKVEREGISIAHPARFVLVGSGNPEEGELRPQLLDRFGLQVQVTTEDDLDRRVEIVERRNAFESNPEKFCLKHSSAQEQLRNKITRAQKQFDSVVVERSLLRKIAQLCTELKVDGHRGELTITRAGRALAALEGRKKIISEDVRRVATMALRHRLRRDPLEEAGGTERINQALDKVFDREPKKSTPSSGDGAEFESEMRNQENAARNGGSETSRPGRKSAESYGNPNLEAPQTTSTPKANVEIPDFLLESSPNVRRQSSANLASQRDVTSRVTNLGTRRGRYAKTVSNRQRGYNIALDATLRAAASAGYELSLDESLSSPAANKRLTSSLRYKQLSRKNGRLFILAIDASGSMAPQRIRQAKGAALTLLKQSYIKRDRVAIVGFRGTSAELLLPPSKSMLRARRVLDSMATGGGTPLTAGLIRSLELAKQDRSGSEIAVLVFTDGNANVAYESNGSVTKPRAERQKTIEQELASISMAFAKAGVKIFVVDSSGPYFSNGKAEKLAARLSSKYLSATQAS
jgi:magnesium chelatase subunit D